MIMKNSNNNSNINIEEIKELRIFTEDGMVSFDTSGLNKIEGYGKYQKDRIQKILHRVFNRIGILAYTDNDGNEKKIDLTRQIIKPQIITKK